uniref:UPF0764 protein C16orf89 homolog n=1 Tax=Saccoglossus kowalevskii TaxID=10224 RepID=A0ABM0MXR8_SACKO|nr:PREDICTED: UPF0764 protein C16orf89 homolog [Saccoglossus kowalevskii]
MNEDATDECVREILGTSADTKPCEVSDACVKLMTTPGYEMYTLSHQVFYLEIVQQEGCATQMVQRMKNDGVDIDPDIMMKTFCTNMLKDAEHIADGGFPSNKQDLFLEEALLCGLDGYREFYRPQWLDHILHWQDSSGCFKSSYTTDFAHQDTNDENKVKRREKILEDGCSSHKTAVAIGTLGGYVRYIMEAMI